MTEEELDALRDFVETSDGMDTIWRVNTIITLIRESGWKSPEEVEEIK